MALSSELCVYSYDQAKALTGLTNISVVQMLMIPSVYIRTYVARLLINYVALWH